MNLFDKLSDNVKSCIVSKLLFYDIILNDIPSDRINTIIKNSIIYEFKITPRNNYDWLKLRSDISSVKSNGFSVSSIKQPSVIKGTIMKWPRLEDTLGPNLVLFDFLYKENLYVLTPSTKIPMSEILSDLGRWEDLHKLISENTEMTDSDWFCTHTAGNLFNAIVRHGLSLRNSSTIHKLIFILLQLPHWYSNINDLTNLVFMNCGASDESIDLIKKFTEWTDLTPTEAFKEGMFCGFNIHDLIKLSKGLDLKLDFDMLIRGQNPRYDIIEYILETFTLNKRQLDQIFKAILEIKSEVDLFLKLIRKFDRIRTKILSDTH